MTSVGFDRLPQPCPRRYTERRGRQAGSMAGTRRHRWVNLPRPNGFRCPGEWRVYRIARTPRWWYLL